MNFNDFLKIMTIFDNPQNNKLWMIIFHSYNFIDFSHFFAIMMIIFDKFQ